jgi:hypothetical protein
MSTIPTALEELRSKSSLSIKLQNCSDEVQECQTNGMFYRFEPGQVLEIEDQRRHQRGKKGTSEVLLFDAPLIVPETWDAARVAARILEKLEPRGVTAILDDGQDPIRVRQAKSTYLKYRVDRAKMVRQEWLAKVEKVTQEPGAVPPPQPDNVRAEFIFLEKYERGTLTRKRYVSKIDSYETDDREELLSYHRAKYPNQVVKDPDTFVIDTQAGLPETPTRKERAAHEVASSPAISSLEEIQELMERAGKYRVKLTVKEMSGLVAQDQDVVSAVIARVAIAASTRKPREETHGEQEEDGSQEVEA